MDRPICVYMHSAGLEDELKVGALKKYRNFILRLTYLRFPAVIFVSFATNTNLTVIFSNENNYDL